MFKTGVLTFSVFSHGDDVDVVIKSLYTRKGFSRSDVSKKVELLSESNVY